MRIASFSALSLASSISCQFFPLRHQILGIVTEKHFLRLLFYF
jgi:hypothetical protein